MVAPEPDPNIQRYGSEKRNLDLELWRALDILGPVAGP
jgi:hypothetical protein